jgi:RNA exonuclease 1
MAAESHQSHESEQNNRKRKHGYESSSVGMGSMLPLLQQPDLPAFNLTSDGSSLEQHSGNRDGEVEDSRDWQLVEGGQRKKAKKVPKAHSSNYPTITFSAESARLQSQIKIGDLQGLVLYVLADGTSPQWISVRHRNEIRKVVVLMVPGLERSMFEEHSLAPEEQLKKNSANNDGGRSTERNYRSPDEYYPVKLSSDELPISLKPFAEIFEYLWPVKTPGDDKYSKMHSPLHAMFTAPLPKSQGDKNKKGPKPTREPQGWQNKRTRISEFITPPEDLLENDYTLHPAIYIDEEDRSALQEQRIRSGTWTEHGWVNTRVNSYEEGTPPENEIEQGSLTAGREIIAMDCEMCMTGDAESSLTRISLVGWDGSVVMDELVKPDKPIVDYVTRYVYLKRSIECDTDCIPPDFQESPKLCLRRLQQPSMTSNRSF